jgi:hypothetical protein
MGLIAGNFLSAAVLVQFPPCSNPSDASQIFRPTDVNAASFASSGGRAHLGAPNCNCALTSPSHSWAFIYPLIMKSACLPLLLTLNLELFKPGRFFSRFEHS